MDEIFEKPITTFELAKEYFFSMGCSHFHMCRENPTRYDEYRKLYISKSIENQWQADRYEQLYNELMQDSGEKIWVLHSSMEELVHSLNTDDAYEKMLDATRYALKNAKDGDRIVIAETINGRQGHEYRAGLIFHAFDRGRKDHAIEFADLSISLAESDNNMASLAHRHRSTERIGRAINDCRSIKKELGL